MACHRTDTTLSHFPTTEQLPMGYRYNAMEHSGKTHQLQIPPDAIGEKDYRIILDQIDEFMGNGSQLPPLFTLKENIAMIESFMRDFCSRRGLDDEDRYRVYPLHQLFYNINEEALNYSLTRESLRSIHIAETILNNDRYAYVDGIACDVSHCDNSSVQF